MSEKKKSGGSGAGIEAGPAARSVKKATWAGLVVNVLLSGFKIAAGTIGNSQAIVADGVHSLSDTTTDVAVLVGVNYWYAPPDEDHPHGHGRIETIVTFLIGLVLALVALGLSYNAAVTFNEPRQGPPGLVALVAALVSLASKEALYQWTAAVGRRIGSRALVANAWHHRSDGLSSIPAALAVVGARLVPEWQFLDQAGAIVVSIFILHAAWRIAWPALKELADTGAPSDDCGAIVDSCLNVEGVRATHKLRTRRIGQGWQVDIHVQVDGDLTVRQGHDIAGKVKQCLVDEGPSIIDVIVHIEPWEEEDSDAPDGGKKNAS